MQLDDTTRNAIIYELTQSFIDEHRPEESPYVRTVWERFLTLEKEGTTQWRLFGLPAISDHDVCFDSPAVMVVLARVCEVLRKRDDDIRAEQLSVVIRDEAETLALQARLIGQMAEFLVPLLLEKTKAIQELAAQPQGGKATRKRRPGVEIESPPKEGMYWVQWCKEAATVEQAKVQQRYCTKEEIGAMRGEQETYTLYAEEDAPNLLFRPRQLKKGQVSREVPWSKIPRQAQLFLGLILDHCGAQSATIRHIPEMKDRVFEGQQKHDSRYRAVKDDLDRVLDSLVDDFCEAEKGKKRYRLKYIPRYCWIRQGKEHSILYLPPG